MEIEKKPLRVRVISGTVAEMEEQLNRLLEHYMAIQWNYAVVKDELRMTVVLFHESVIRMQQIAQAGLSGRGH
jgi:hypothetical protein